MFLQLIIYFILETWLKVNFYNIVRGGAKLIRLFLNSLRYYLNKIEIEFDNISLEIDKPRPLVYTRKYTGV